MPVWGASLQRMEDVEETPGVRYGASESAAIIKSSTTKSRGDRSMTRRYDEEGQGVWGARRRPVPRSIGLLVGTASVSLLAGCGGDGAGSGDNLDDKQVVALDPATLEPIRSVELSANGSESTGSSGGVPEPGGIAVGEEGVFVTLAGEPRVLLVAKPPTEE